MNARCVQCGKEHSASVCPSCGSEIQPFLLSKDVTVPKINWDGLVLLANFASMWAENFLREDEDVGRIVLASVLRDLRVLRPEGGVQLTVYEYCKENGYGYKSASGELLMEPRNAHTDEMPYEDLP